jgi:hypothetical protein
MASTGEGTKFRKIRGPTCVIRDGRKDPWKGASMPTLTDTSILFRTNDNDKDADTNVTVECRDNEGEIFARLSDPLGKFDDQTSNGPFDLELLNRPDKARVDGGNVLLRIDPKGDDEWHFNYQLECRFDDGSTVTSAADGLVMNEHEMQQQMFGLPS